MFVSPSYPSHPGVWSQYPASSSVSGRLWLRTPPDYVAPPNSGLGLTYLAVVKLLIVPCIFHAPLCRITNYEINNHTMHLPPETQPPSIALPLQPIAPRGFETPRTRLRHQDDYGLEHHQTTWRLQTLDSNSYNSRWSISPLYPASSPRFSSSALLRSTTLENDISYPRISVVVDNTSYH